MAIEIRATDIQEVLGLSEAELAQALGVDKRSVSRWKTGAALPQVRARQRLDELKRLTDRLRATFESDEAARAWTRAPSRYFGGLTPRQALLVGEVERVSADLEGLDSGIFL